MDDGGDQQIIPGIFISPTGQATVDPTLTVAETSIEGAQE